MWAELRSVCLPVLGTSSSSSASPGAACVCCIGVGIEKEGVSSAGEQRLKGVSWSVKVMLSTCGQRLLFFFSTSLVCFLQGDLKLKP